MPHHFYPSQSNKVFLSRELLRNLSLFQSHPLRPAYCASARVTRSPRPLAYCAGALRQAPALAQAHCGQTGASPPRQTCRSAQARIFSVSLPAALTPSFPLQGAGSGARSAREEGQPHLGGALPAPGRPCTNPAGGRPDVWARASAPTRLSPR